jgi:hypothetical protein
MYFLFSIHLISLYFNKKKQYTVWIVIFGEMTYLRMQFVEHIYEQFTVHSALHKVAMGTWALECCLSTQFYQETHCGGPDPFNESLTD